MDFSVYDGNGRRKYLTRNETKLFLKEAETREPLVHSFCWIIALTGCRISEALSLTAENIDLDDKQVVIESLKKRGKQIFRAVPLPYGLLDKLHQWLADGTLAKRGRLWPWSRMTGYRRVREVMDQARITGEHASPKGLRHGFAVQAIQSRVPLNLVQRWLGHADIKTTSIYTAAMGPEERTIASQMWRETLDGAVAPRPAPDRMAEIRRQQRLRVFLNESKMVPDPFGLIGGDGNTDIRWLEAALRTLLGMAEASPFIEPAGCAPAGCTPPDRLLAHDLARSSEQGPTRTVRSGTRH